MGLDFTANVPQDDDSPRWSYSGFNSFRERLAEAINVPLRSMVGFGGDQEWDADDPIVPLLNHSDCDGELSPDDCGRVSPRLRELIAAWAPDDYDRVQGEKLATMMAECAEAGEPLIFC